MITAPLRRAPRTSAVQNVARWLLGAALLFAGTTHLTTARGEFRAQVPGWLPVDPDLVVVVSGVAEIGLGSGLLLLARARVLVGMLTAGLFVAVFPGNIAQYVERTDAFGLESDRARLARLLFQPPLVLWALWSTGALTVLRDAVVASLGPLTLPQTGTAGP